MNATKRDIIDEVIRIEGGYAWAVCWGDCVAGPAPHTRVLSDGRAVISLTPEILDVSPDHWDYMTLD